MQVVRLFTGPDGESHFEDVEVDLEDFGAVGRMSNLWEGRGVIFREVDGDYDLDFHVAPRRQLIVTLDGWVEIENGLGESRRFGPGSMMLAEDLTGRGHLSRAVDGQSRTCLFLPLDDDTATR